MAIAALIGVAALLARLFDVPLIASGIHGLPPVKPNAAILILVLCAATVLLRDRWWARQIAGALATVVILFGLATSMEHSLGADFGIDELAIADRWAPAGTTPGRMPVAAAAAFVLLGCAVILRLHRRLAATSELAATLAAALTFFVILSYLFKVPIIDKLAGSVAMAAPAAVALFVLSLAMLVTNESAQWLNVLFDKQSIGARVARLGLVIVVPALIAVSWLEVEARKAIVFGDAEGDALHSTFVTFLVTAVVIFAAHLVRRHEIEKTRQQRELSESEARWRTTFERAGVGIAHTEAVTGKLLQVNPKFCSMLGYTQEELIGLSISDITASEDIELSRRAIEEVRRGLADHINIQKSYRRKDGSVVVARVIANPVRGDQGEVLYFISMVEDITEALRAREALRSSDERFRLAAAATNDSIYDWDLITDRVWWGEGMQGFKPEHAGLDWWLSRIHPEDRQSISAQMAALLTSTNDRWTGEYRFSRADGSYARILDRCYVLRDSSGTATRMIGAMADITSIREAEAILRDTQATLELMVEARTEELRVERDFATATFETTGTVMAVLDRQRRIVRFNAAAERLTGWSREEVIGDDVGRFLLPEEVAGVEKFWQDLIASPTSNAYENHWVTRSGDRRLLSWKNSAIEDANGETQFVVTSGMDITEERHAREVVETKFRRVFETNTVAIGFWKWDGTITDANEAYLLLTGYTREDLAAGKINWKSLNSLVAPEENARVMQLLRTKGIVPPMERSYVRSDGSVVPILLSVSALAGDTFDGVSVILDMTEQKEAKAALLSTEERFRVLLENSHDATTVLDASGRNVFVSDSIERLLGYQPQELLGINAFDLVHPDDRAEMTCLFADGVAAKRSSAHAEYRYRHRDGSWRWLESVGQNLLDHPAVRGIVVNSRDVTESRMYQKQLEQAERLSSLGRLAATMAHEFNNVMMGIQPFAEVIRREANENQRIGSACNHIESSIKRGRRVTQDILRFTRPAEPTLGRIDVTEWIPDLAAELRGMLGTRHDLDLRLPDQPVMILGDRAQLTQALSNIVINARDAMPEGGRVAVTVEELDDTNIRISVIDHGSGISPSIQKNIFEPLFTTKKNGNGLGLALTHQVVTRHGGKIVVESTVGKGSIFHIELPRGITTQPVAVQPATDTSRRPAGNRRILIVEDDLAVGEGLRELLQAEGYAVRLVERGADAPAAMREFRPDLLILDIGLPDVDGLDLFGLLLKEDPAITCIFSTGHGDQGKLASPELKRQTRFLQKPYESGQLMGLIEEVLVSEALAV